MHLQPFIKSVQSVTDYLAKKSSTGTGTEAVPLCTRLALFPHPRG